MEICTAISKEVFALVGFAYVDDCDLIQSGLEPRRVINSMQDLIQNWGSLMGVTGGKISVEKSWWYLVEYVWKKGKWVTNDAELDYDLVAQTSNGLNVSLKRLYANEASEMLGVWLAPDGGKTTFINLQQTKL